MAKKKGNNYIIDEEKRIAKIELHRRKEENLWSIIDLEDLDRVINFPYTWYARYYKNIDGYYAQASMYLPEVKRPTPIYLHQFIMNANGKTVDHENHDTLDDRKNNLRVIEDSNNSKNRKSRNINNKSGYRNVSWDGYNWVVRLQVNGENTVLGKFSKNELEEAGKFAEEMREKYYGKFAGNS